MSDHEPLGSIEERHGQESMGALAVNVYRGALAEADGDHALALRATIAWCAGMMAKPPEPENEEDDKK